jgi:EAL domain-containing protein (putative c-di-GMP-specific phosphodiesterase class I)
VAQILDHTRIEPSRLELEITESVVMDQSEASVERLRGPASARRAAGA